MTTVKHNDTTWTLGAPLGKGLSGEVRVALRAGDEKKFAMKVVDFPALVTVFRDFDVTAETLESNLMREIEVMRRLRHRNIIYLDDSFWIDTKLYMSMELVEGKDLLRSITPGGLKEEVAKDYFFQLCSAISYCHANNVIHGDLKPENILIREKDHRLKLIDFGFSHIVKPGEQLEVIGGTVLYSPPDDPDMTFSFDDWSCGIILFAMLSCSLPFPEADLSAKKHLTLNIPENISDDAVDIIVGLLNPIPRGRESVSDVLATAAWLDSERGKELPETMTTLALARQMSRPRVADVPTLPISRKPSEMPLVEHEKDVKIWGRFLQKIKGPQKSKSKADLVIPSSLVSDKRRDSTMSALEKVASVDTKAEKEAGRTNSQGSSFFSRSPGQTSRSPARSPPTGTPKADPKERRRSFLGRGSESGSPTFGLDNHDKGSKARSPKEDSASLNLNSDSESDDDEESGHSKRHKHSSKKRVSGMAMASLDELPLGFEGRSPPKERKGSLIPGPKMPFQKKLPPPSFPSSSVTESPSKKIFMKGSRSNYDFDEGGDTKSDFGKVRDEKALNASFDRMSERHDEQGVKPKGSPPFLKDKFDTFSRRRSIGSSQDETKSTSRLGSNASDAFPSVVSDVDFVLRQLKSFEETEKKLVDSLNRLFHFQEMVVQESIMSASEAADIAPASLKDIRSIHQSVYSTLQSLFGEANQSQRPLMTMTDVGCTLEAVLSILASDRTYTSYITYAKDYPNCINLLRYLRKKVDFTRLGHDVQDVHSIVSLPLSRLGEYNIVFGSLFDDMDERARKSLVSAIKLLDGLFKKARTKAMPKIYS